MDPIASMAQKKADERRKADKSKAAQGGLLSPGVIKGAFVAALVALFVAGVLIQFERNKASERNDPAAAMRREMGMMDLEGNTFVPTSSFQQQYDKLASGDAEVRIEGINGMLGENPSGALPIIRGLLGDADPRVRVHAAQVLGERKTAGFASSLVPLLADAVPEVRAAAARSLGSYTDDPGVLYLLSSPLGNADQAIALNALEVWKAFSRTNEAAAVGVLVEAFRSPNDDVVIAAMNAGANGLTSEYLLSLQPEYDAVAASRAGTPVGDEAAKLAAFVRAQNAAVVE